MGCLTKEKQGYAILFFCAALSAFNFLSLLRNHFFLNAAVSAIIFVISAYLIFLQHRYGILCKGSSNCLFVKREKENGIENLKIHLSEHRHDFLNILQIVYGYIQLKKSEKNIPYIKKFSKKIENLGKLYNKKCIKLADLLYTKEKDANIIDCSLDININIPFDSSINDIESDSLIYVLDGIIANYFYNIQLQNISDAVVVFTLTELENAYEFELKYEESQCSNILFQFVKEDISWERLYTNVPSLNSIKDICKKSGYEIDINYEESSTVIIVNK